MASKTEPELILGLSVVSVVELQPGWNLESKVELIFGTVVVVILATVLALILIPGTASVLIRGSWR